MANVMQLLRIINRPRFFSPDERWEEYADLLPGFSALDKNSAYTIYKQTSRIDYKTAHTPTIMDEDKRMIDNVDGIGFIELASGDGAILLSKELKRAFLYRYPNGSQQQLYAIAGSLMQAAGWGGDARGMLKLGHIPPHDELGMEIEREHRLARRAEYRPSWNGWREREPWREPLSLLTR